MLIKNKPFVGNPVWSYNRQHFRRRPGALIPTMPVIACGINYKTAPVALREQVFFGVEKLPIYLKDLTASGGVEEGVLLSTCNRSELYCQGETDARALLNWFARQHGLPPSALADVFFCHEHDAAVAHIMEVACGLDSMIPMESQIFGQMKAAFAESCAAGTVGPLFNRLFQQVFSVAKAVRASSDLGACPVSVSSAAVRFITGKFPDLARARILLLGTGLTMDLVLRHLMPYQPRRVTVAGRNASHAETLADKYQVSGVDLARCEDLLSKADILISATGSPQPLITRSMLAHRKSPLLIVDIAVPRDIEAAVGEFDPVSLYCIDDLRVSLQQGLDIRRHQAEKAREVILERTASFMEWLQSVDLVTETIRAFRGRMEYFCEIELERAKRQLDRGEDPAKVLSLFARALTQKMLHSPSVQLRQAGVEGRVEMLQLARELFAMPDSQMDPA